MTVALPLLPSPRHAVLEVLLAHGFAGEATTHRLVQRNGALIIDNTFASSVRRRGGSAGLCRTRSIATSAPRWRPGRSAACESPR